MFIVIVVIISFGVSIQSLLFPNQELNWTLLANIFLPSYFIMAGDDRGLTETILGTFNVGLSGKQYSYKQKYNFIKLMFVIWIKDQDCKNKSLIYNLTDYKVNRDTDCPNYIGAIVGLILLILYNLILVTMLINLLIALFG